MNNQERPITSATDKVNEALNQLQSVSKTINQVRDEFGLDPLENCNEILMAKE